jgi:hypothetical protein
MNLRGPYTLQCCSRVDSCLEQVARHGMKYAPNRLSSRLHLLTDPLPVSRCSANHARPKHKKSAIFSPTKTPQVEKVSRSFPNSSTHHASHNAEIKARKNRTYVQDGKEGQGGVGKALQSGSRGGGRASFRLCLPSRQHAEQVSEGCEKRILRQPVRCNSSQ